jgi:uncharacterized membrane-anchored protein
MKTKLLFLVVALQSAWVVGTIVMQEIALRSGVVVRLETEPVDPRDLLRGDYVILNYKISTVPINAFPPDQQGRASVADGEPVHILLDNSGDYHGVASASLQPITDESGRPVLRGTIHRHWRSLNETNAPVRVEYGLERYYVREGTGNPRGKLTVDVAVPNNGRGIIQQVYLDGVPYAEAMREHAK